MAVVYFAQDGQVPFFQGETESKDDYYHLELGWECQSVYGNGPLVEAKHENIEAGVADIRIGPCGHLYGYNDERWQFIYLDTAGQLIHKMVNVKLSGGANLNDCAGCAMRVDQVGNLWYRGDDGKILVYNPFKNRVTLKTKNLV